MGKIFCINRQSYSLMPSFNASPLSLFSFLAAAIFFAQLTFSSSHTQAEIAPEIASTISAKKQAIGQQWMVVTANDYATSTAVDILKQGFSQDLFHL